MRITGLESAGAPVSRLGPDAAPARGEFGDLLRRSVAQLTALQAAADRAAESVALGDLTQLHEAVLAMQKASLAPELVVTVRNHVVDGVQELLRTQV